MEEEQKGDSNVILFTALGMILLAFFIMLNNMASLDSSRTRAALDSLLGTFGVMKGHEMENGLGGPPELEASDEKEAEETVEEQPPEAVYELVRQKLADRPVRGADVEMRTDGRVVIRLEEEMAFAVGGHHLSPRYFATLDRVAEIVDEVGYPVRVEGHTDAAQPRGARSNWYLSAARATSVHRYLTATSTVSSAMVHPVGYAASRIDPERSDTDQRRVELVFLPPREPRPDHDSTPQDEVPQ